MPARAKRKTHDADDIRKTSGTSRSLTPAVANSDVVGRMRKPASEINDYRPRTAQLVAMQNRIQLASNVNAGRRFIRSRDTERLTASQGLELQTENFGDNWEVLEISDYMKRHQLQLRRMSRGPDKNVMHLSDGSMILIDSNQFWRHQSAEMEERFFDSDHGISRDSSRTYFWTRKGYAHYKTRLSG